jgi:signal transduction histidine kinase
VDDDACPSPDPVLQVGHSNRALLGHFSRAPKLYQVAHKPYYYETDLFRLSLVAFGLLLMAALYQYRIHQAAEKFHARMEGTLAERERVARDLHDTPLQGIQGLVMLFAYSGDVNGRFRRDVNKVGACDAGTCNDA